MAWRAALLAALPFLPICSAIAFTRTASAAEPQLAAGEDDAGKSTSDDRVPAAEADCQTVQAGTACYESVDWLRRYGLSKHPDWYPGYTSESTFEEVQDMLHGLGKVNCPKPCFVERTPADNCEDVAQGGCYESIVWLQKYGLERHPDWYPSLQPSSSLSEIQAELHRTGKVNCPQPCALSKKALLLAPPIANTTGLEQAAARTEQCMDAKPDTPCYSAVIYGINEGISKYPHMYQGFTVDGGLTFKKVQEYLYLQARPGQAPCGMPCPAEQVDLETLAKHPEDLRVKKRVEDMSMQELGDFFSGKWDGYVSKMVHGDWQPATTTFEKRLYDPTTTVPEYQLPDYKLPLPLVDDDSNDMVNAPAEAANTTEKTEAAGDAERTEVAGDSEEAANTTEKTIDSVPEAAADVAEEVANTTEEAEAAIAARFGMAAGAAEPAEAASATEKVAGAAEPEEAANATEPAEVAGAAEPEEAAGAAMPEEAANGTVPEEASNATADASSASAEEAVQDGDIVDEPMPQIDGQGHDTDMADFTPAEPETREEMEQRIRKQLMGEMQRQTTTVAVETEEEMRQRLKAELMREIMASKGQ